MDFLFTSRTATIEKQEMGRRAKDLIGRYFGSLKVIERAGSKFRKNSTRRRDAAWRCICDCGNERVLASYSLIKRKTDYCNCYRCKGNSENKYRPKRKHNPRTKGESYTKEYRAWAKMIHRCNDKDYACFRYYGARGICVCERWRSSYESFLADMGRCPNGFSLDRVDVNGNYEPSNCRWASATTQSRNQRVGINNMIGVRGVGQRENGKFRARIHINRKPIYLGTFNTISDALQARKEAELKYW